VKSILLTNDDGIEAEGLRVLEETLQRVAYLIVVAPDGDRSGVSHGLTVHSSPEVNEIRPDWYAVKGTPADCVVFALRKLFVTPPDMVVSGINHGANLGDNLMYSGTVAAAREAAKNGIPAMAISQVYEDVKSLKFKNGMPYIKNLVDAMHYGVLRKELLLNVNIPPSRIRGVKITRQGFSEYPKNSTQTDRLHTWKDDIVSDHQAIKDGYISITPLQRDQTDYAAAKSLEREAALLFGAF